MLHEFIQTFHEFNKIKYTLNLFLQNLLKLSGAKISYMKQFSLWNLIYVLKLKKATVIALLRVLTNPET